MAIALKSKDTTRHIACPQCKSTDIRGPIDTEPSGPFFHFTRSWFCRVCWWDVSIKLRDDVAEAAANRVLQK
jgi:hypothetical protein